MKKHLFLTGPSGCGKTTMIRNALGSAIAGAGGLITERVSDSQGTVLGYELTAAAAAAGVEGYPRLRFLDYSRRPPAHDNEVFRVEGVRLLEEAEYYPFSVIDEFGGFELIIPQFRKALEVFLSSEQPIIGVIKGQENAEQLRNSLGLGDKYALYVQRLREALSADPDTLILEVRGRDDRRALRLVRQWCEKYAGL